MKLVALTMGCLCRRVASVMGELHRVLVGRKEFLIGRARIHKNITAEWAF